MLNIPGRLMAALMAFFWSGIPTALVGAVMERQMYIASYDFNIYEIWNDKTAGINVVGGVGAT
jgi:hypothetical protein